MEHLITKWTPRALNRTALQGAQKSQGNSRLSSKSPAKSKAAEQLALSKTERARKGRMFLGAVATASAYLLHDTYDDLQESDKQALLIESAKAILLNAGFANDKVDTALNAIATAEQISPTNDAGKYKNYIDKTPIYEDVDAWMYQRWVQQNSTDAVSIMFGNRRQT